MDIYNREGAQLAHSLAPEDILQVDAAASNAALVAEIKRLEHKVARLRRDEVAGITEIHGLQARIARGIISFGRDWDERPDGARQTTWQEDIRNGGNTKAAIMIAYKKACAAGNMSRVVIHPGLTLKVAPSRPFTPRGCGKMPRQPFPFMKLPAKIKAKIFNIWLVKSTLIHAISRTDPFGKLGINPRTRDGYPRKFHWERSECAIRDAKDPREVLKLLLVSKSFCHMGASCFYSMNTFALSSLGELGRFLRGIGPERRQRIRALSITWIGARMRKLYKHSTRTRPLHVLTEMRQLTKIDIHLDESNSSRERRIYEEEDIKAILGKPTKNQLNCRSLRSLRTVQGMDYLYQLRGIKVARVFDYNLALRDQEVQDSYFVDDLRAQICSPKSTRAKLNATWDNLDPFFTDWNTPSGVQKVTKQFFTCRESTFGGQLAGPAQKSGKQRTQPDITGLSELLEANNSIDGHGEGNRSDKGPGKKKDGRILLNIGGSYVNKAQIIDLTGDEHILEDVILESIEVDIQHLNSHFESRETIKDEDDETSHRETCKTSGMFMSPFPVTSEEEAQERLLKRKMRYTHPSQKQLRLQGSAPI